MSKPSRVTWHFEAFEDNDGRNDAVETKMFGTEAEFHRYGTNSTTKVRNFLLSPFV